MNLKEILTEAFDVSWSVLETLGESLDPWSLQEICARHALPPIDLGMEWTEAVAQVRIDLASGLLGDAECWARITYLADLLADRVRVGLGAGSAVDVLAWLRPFVLHALLSLAAKSDRGDFFDFIVWTSAGLLLMDIRVQESFLGGAAVHRAEYTRFNERIVYLLQHDPIVLPALALPPGTRQQRPPDWTYRREILEDPRQDGDRLAGSLPPLLRPPSDGIGAMAQSVVDRVRWQGSHAPGRRWIPRSNVGVVTFHGTIAAPFARHSLYTFELSNPLSPGRPYVVVDAALTALPTEVAPMVPVEGALP